MFKLDVLSDTLKAKFSNNEHQTIFIISPPRNGGTIVYQYLIDAWNLGYIANVTEQHFTSYPLIGLALQESPALIEDITSHNRFGHTIGAFQPSEGTQTLFNWFPRSICGVGSRKPMNEFDFHNFLCSAYRLFNRPFIIKNSWNCFRLDYLATLDPDKTFFIFVRRNLEDAVYSELYSRYITRDFQDQPTCAVPPYNYGEEAWEKLPYWVKVIETQKSYSKIVETDRAKLHKFNYAVIDFEDFILDPVKFEKNIYDVITKFKLQIIRKPPQDRCVEIKSLKNRWEALPSYDFKAVYNYLHKPEF